MLNPEEQFHRQLILSGELKQIQEVSEEFLQ